MAAESSCIRRSSDACLACSSLFRHVRQCNPLKQERRKVEANLGNYEIKSQHLQGVPQNGNLPICCVGMSLIQLKTKHFLWFHLDGSQQKATLALKLFLSSFRFTDWQYSIFLNWSE